MHFCPKCNNMYTITSTVAAPKQKGGDKSTINYDKLAREILIKRDVTIPENIRLDRLVEAPSYKRMSLRDKEYVHNKVSDTLKKKGVPGFRDGEQGRKNIHFKCLSCGHHETINDRTLIYTSVGSDISQTYEVSDISMMKHSDILPRTRKYVCPNEECVSHKVLSQREAVFFRLNNSYMVRYICVACDTHFNMR